MAGSFEGIEEALRVAYPARAVGVLVEARSAFLGVLAERQQQMAGGPRWTVEITFIDDVTVLKGTFNDASTAWSYAETYRKTGYVQLKLTEDGQDSFVMYPMTSVVKMHCRPISDFEETVDA